MSFFNFLEKIRSLPRFVRIQILWFCVLVLMGAIVSLWVVSFDGSFFSRASLKGEVSQPFGQVKDELPSLKKAFQDSLGAFFEEKPEEETGAVYEEIPVYEKTEKSQPARLPLRP